jgi:hypothetical protein
MYIFRKIMPSLGGLHIVSTPLFYFAIPPGVSSIVIVINLMRVDDRELKH